MPRYARIHVTGGMFHVICRFHDKRYYLDVEGAREKYLKLLGQAVLVHDARVIGYCLMSSHIHLVIQLGNDSLGSLMKRVNSPFGNWINAMRKGIGSVMADRPKSILVHTETYGMDLIRYIHNNPVRAGVVSRASESGWSSHRAYLGLEETPSWLATDAVFGSDISRHESIRRDFSEYVDEGRNETRRPEFSGEMSPELSRRIRRLMGGEFTFSYPVIGPDAFVRDALKQQAKKHHEHQQVSKKISVEEITERVFYHLDLSPELAVSRSRRKDIALGRALVSWIWVERLGRPQIMVAEGLNFRGAAISIMIKKLRGQKLSPEHAALIESVLCEIENTEKNQNRNNSTTGTREFNDTNKDAPQVFIQRRKRKN